MQERFDVARLPYSVQVLLGYLLRCEDGEAVTAEDVEALRAGIPREPVALRTPSSALMIGLALLGVVSQLAGVPAGVGAVLGLSLLGVAATRRSPST